MNKSNPIIYAFIDNQNLNLGVRDQGWILDFARFRKYLSDKYKVSKFYLFIGYIPTNKNLYDHLRKAGYILIFKPVLGIKLKNSQIIKGNVDAELVLHTMIELKNYDKAVIVTGDGDFECLIKYLISINKFLYLVIPNKYKYSTLLRKFEKYTIFIYRKLKDKLELKERH